MNLSMSNINNMQQFHTAQQSWGGANPNNFMTATNMNAMNPNAKGMNQGGMIPNTLNPNAMMPNMMNPNAMKPNLMNQMPMAGNAMNPAAGFNAGYNPGIMPPNVMQNQAFIPQKPQPLFVKLENFERGFYSNLWSQVDPTERGKITGKEAVPFFQRSGLPKDILREIWLLSSPTNETLDKDEFYVALRLIAYAQNKMDVSRESIISNLKAPLPKLAPIEKKQPPSEVVHQEEQQAQAQAQAQAQPQPQPQMQVQTEPQFQPQSIGMGAGMGMGMGMGLGQQLQVQPVLSNPQNFGEPIQQQPMQFGQSQTQSLMDTQSTNFQTNAPTASSASAFNTIQAPLDPLAIVPEQLHRYEAHFEKVDTFKTGLFTSEQAKDLFARSNLPNEVLFVIWQTCDTDSKGCLDKAEFLVAVHLIALARNGVEMTGAMPGCLSKFLIEYRKQLPPKDELINRYQKLFEQQNQSLPDQSPNKLPGSLTDLSGADAGGSSTPSSAKKLQTQNNFNFSPRTSLQRKNFSKILALKSSFHSSISIWF